MTKLNRAGTLHFTLVGGKPKLETYINSFILQIIALISTQQNKILYNLSPMEQKELRNKQARIIKPADKKGAIVMINTNIYVYRDQKADYR